MKDVLDVVEDWSRGGRSVALATVVDTKKSAPQPAGTKMAVNDTGALIGAVSGGCVEGAVVQVAERILRGEAGPQLLDYGIADEDAWDVGLPCGGEISIWAELYRDDGPQAAFTEVARRGGRAALVTAIAGAPEAGAKLLVVDGAPGAVGTLGDPALDLAAAAAAEEAMWAEHSELREEAGATLFVDAVAPPPRLIIFGAVDYAAQLAAFAKLAGWRAFV